MIEEKAKATVLREVENIEALEGIPQDQRAITYIKDKPNERKFALVALVPKTDEESQARYKVPLSTLITKGVIQLLYGLKDEAIKAILGSEDSEEEMSHQLQIMADEKTCERTVSTGVKTVQKAKAAKMDSLESRLAAAGTTLEEFEAEIAKKLAKASKNR